MIKKERRQNVFYGILALFFSLVLFFIASGSSLQVNLAGTSNPYEEEIDNVPIQTTYDTDEYFIQGFETTVDVTLSSRNRVQLNAERSEETRSFRVVADLTGLDEGTHEVPLEVKNISSSVTAEIEPKTVTVTIEKKVTQTFTVEPVISTDGATSGYGVDSMSVEPQEVEITTGDKTLAEIDRVVAIVNPDDITGDSITVDGTIEAWDSENNPLAIIPEPDSVDVALMMEAPSKEIELFVTQQGTTPDGISHYIYRMSSISAVLTGPQSILDETQQIGVPVDVSEITTTTERTVTIPVPEGTTINPTVVTIQITPVAETTTENQSNNDGDEATNSANSQANSSTVDTTQEQTENSASSTTTSSS